MCGIVPWHNWGRWTPYDVKKPERKVAENWFMAECTEHRQKRTCNKCGYTETEIIGITLTNKESS